MKLTHMLFILTVLWSSIFIQSASAEPEHLNTLTETGLYQFTPSSSEAEKYMASEQAQHNAMLRLKRKIYSTIAAYGEEAGIFFVKNSSILPAVDKIISNATFSKPRTVIPDLLEVEVTLNRSELSKVIAPVLLGKNPSLIEFSSSELVVPKKQNNNDDNDNNRQLIEVVVPSPLALTPPLFPSLGAHEQSINDSLRLSLAHFIIDGGSIVWKKSSTNKSTSPIARYTASSVGHLRNSTIFLSDSDGAQLVSTLKNLDSPKNTALTIFVGKVLNEE